MISTRHEALLAGLAYRSTFSAWTVWDDAHALSTFHAQLTAQEMNPAYHAHLWREFQLAAFSGDSRLIAPERTFTVSQVARLLCMSYQTVQASRDIVVIEGRVSAADFIVYANKQMSRQRELI